MMFSEPVERNINGRAARLIRGDLTDLDVDAIVHYAREDLKLGAGYGGAIQERGGLAIARELEPMGEISAGQAVITCGGELKARFIIHACGPKFMEEHTEEKLSRCMNSALELAGARGVASIAFPAMGAGFYGIPLKMCADVMLSAISVHLSGETSIKEVIICAVDKREYDGFAESMRG